MQKILVTGGLGFIGTHVAISLSKEFLVTVIDSLSEELYPRDYKLRSARQLENQQNFVKIINAPMESLTPAELMEFDGIINLAALPGLSNSWHQPKQLWSSNVSSLQALLANLSKLDSKPFVVHASTSSVYGRIATADEGARPNPISPYGVSKLAAEQILELVSNEHRIPHTSLRLFSVYGPGQRPEMAYSKAIHCALTGDTFHRFGDGNQSRANTFVGDVAESFSLATKALITQRSLPPVINIGGDEKASLNEVLSKISKLTGKSFVIRPAQALQGDQLETKADISLARKTLGWQPKTGLEEGLRRQIEWQRTTE